jgi:hypothetical protein
MLLARSSLDPSWSALPLPGNEARNSSPRFLLRRKRRRRKRLNALDPIASLSLWFPLQPASLHLAYMNQALKSLTPPSYPA